MKSAGLTCRMIGESGGSASRSGDIQGASFGPQLRKLKMGGIRKRHKNGREEMFEGEDIKKGKEW